MHRSRFFATLGGTVFEILSLFNNLHSKHSPKGIVNIFIGSAGIEDLTSFSIVVTFFTVRLTNITCRSSCCVTAKTTSILGNRGDTSSAHCRKLIYCESRTIYLRCAGVVVCSPDRPRNAQRYRFAYIQLLFCSIPISFSEEFFDRQFLVCRRWLFGRLATRCRRIPNA